jgi:hypothetical protein
MARKLLLLTLEPDTVFPTRGANYGVTRSLGNVM